MWVWVWVWVWEWEWEWEWVGGGVGGGGGLGMVWVWVWVQDWVYLSAYMHNVLLEHPYCWQGVCGMCACEGVCVCVQVNW